MYSVVLHSLLVIPVVGGEFSAHSCNSYCLSCLEVTSEFRENGMNFQCNVGATQPLRIDPLPPSRKFTQLGGCNIFHASRDSTRLCGCRILNSFCYGPCIGCPHSPPSTPLFLPPPSVFPIIVWTGGLPAPAVQCSTYPLDSDSLPYPPPVPIIILASLPTELNTSIIVLYISDLLLSPPQIAQCPRISVGSRC